MYQFFIINYNYDHIYKYIYINNSLFYKIEFYIYFSLFKILQLLLLNGSFDYLPKKKKSKRKLWLEKYREAHWSNSYRLRSEQVSGFRKDRKPWSPSAMRGERRSPNFLNFKLRGHRVARGAGTNFLISPHRGVFIKNKKGHPIRSREARV